MKRFYLLVVSLFVSVSSFAQNGDELSKQLHKYGQMLFYIQNFYLDSVDFVKLVDKAAIATLKELDPHSNFMSAEDVAALNDPLYSQFEGIGIEFAIINDTLTVQAPVMGGPSSKVGIVSGDKIVSVDGENIADIGLTNEKVYKYLRGKKGTKVTLGIVRRGASELLIFDVVRDVIPLNSLDAAYLMDNGALYVKLSRFAASSYTELISAFKGKPGIKGLILDLRGNSGGYMHIAVQITNEFLSRGDLIVYTEGRKKLNDIRQHADGSGAYPKGPLVVLVDENSASASEILAGAIQDQDRGVIVGRRTFGKGLVQQMLPLSDGSEIRLTVAKYHTPSGRVIQSPYKKGEREKYYQDVADRFDHGESFSKDSIHFADSLKFRTLVTNRVVYGGGGIMPDIFVPIDTSYYTPYYGSLIRKGVVSEYVNEISDLNRVKWLRKYPQFDLFDKKFRINDDIFDGLIEYGEKKGIPPVPQEIAVSRATLENYVKALIASNIYGRDEFYKVIHSGGDEELEMAIDVINNWDKYSDSLMIRK